MVRDHLNLRELAEKPGTVPGFSQVSPCPAKLVPGNFPAWWGSGLLVCGRTRARFENRRQNEQEIPGMGGDLLIRADIGSGPTYVCGRRKSQERNL